MSRRELDLLIVNDVANEHYTTGYDGWSFYAPQVVLVLHVEEQSTAPGTRQVVC
jgi:Creatinase/Prolidase N-terminal domain